MVPNMTVHELLSLMVDVKFVKVTEPTESSVNDATAAPKTISAFKILMNANRAYEHLPQAKM
jgi:MinD superfamily P-loop ATPase